MGSGKVPVSCYIRTLNEAGRIGPVVAAARELVSEVVVVDSGSTDGTVAEAEAQGARVVHQPWLGNGFQKRAGEDLCQNDYLLDLDADEVVTPELADQIRALFAKGAPAHPIYSIRLVTVPPVGRTWWGFGLADRTKLYDKRVVRAPEHKAWDQFDIPAGATVGHLRGPLLHYSFRDLAHQMDKLNKVSNVRAREGYQRSRFMVAIRVLFALPFYFIKHYIMRGFFRAGIYGFAYAGISAHGRWLRDVKMYEQILMDRERAKKDRA